jgi:hypothetical protein
MTPDDFCELDFSTPIVSGQGAGVTDDGIVKACIVQRSWLRAWCRDNPGHDYHELVGKHVPDSHPSISPVLQRFAISFNDGLSDDDRQILKPYEERLLGTKADEATELRRSWMAMDWLVRTFTPTWLRKAKLENQAAALEALPALTGSDLAEQALPIIRSAQKDAAAAGDDGWAAAWAAGDAAGDAAWAAAGDTKDGYERKYAAARKAADEILRPAFADIVAELRQSALRLLDDMIELSAVPA